jgi:hypothetical protein
MLTIAAPIRMSSSMWYVHARGCHSVAPIYQAARILRARERARTRAAAIEPTIARIT